MTDPSEIQDLRVNFRLWEGLVRALDGVSLAVPFNGTLGLVGESGCGSGSGPQEPLL